MRMNENMHEEKPEREAAAGDRKREKRGMQRAREIPPQLPEPAERLVSPDICTRFR